jgi:hypothetical protein
MMRRMERIGLAEAFGLSPLGAVLRDVRRSAVGTEHAPPNLWGLSSARIFKPSIGLPTWLGRRRADRRVPIYNFFNRVPAPKGEGYSVRVTYCRDWNGGQWTYDGHLGTDFACPVGTPIVSAAPGVVLRIANEMDRGGLKVCVDHGEGLFTTHNHLARALVRVGQRVRRGDVVGLSGASGMEFVLFFPWVAPHLHYNTWLDGQPTDPFAAPGETSLWRRANDPVPFDGREPAEDARFEPTPWDPAGVAEAIAACRDPAVRALAWSKPTLAERAAEILVWRSYRTAMFDAFPPLSRTRFGRNAKLDLPFRAADFVGIASPYAG